MLKKYQTNLDLHNKRIATKNLDIVQPKGRLWGRFRPRNGTDFGAVTALLSLATELQNRNFTAHARERRQ